MSPISKCDALELAASIKRARIAAEARAKRTGGSGGFYPGFVGGLEAVISHFVGMRAGSDAWAAIEAAFNYEPTEADIAERAAQLGITRAAPC